MHIAISASFIDEPTTGSGQYLHGLLGALPAVAPDLRLTLLLPTGKSASLAQKAWLADTPRPSSLVVRTPFDRISLNLAKLFFEQVAAPQAARLIGADLLHVPYFAPPLRSPVPTVVSILDLIPLLLPEYRGRALVRAYMRLAAVAAPRADHVIAISQAGRDDIVRHLQILPERISVTHLAAARQFHPIDRAAAQAEVARRFSLRAPFVYYVGGLDARKNIPMLIRAFAQMRRSGGPAATLAIAGRARGDDPVLFPDIDAAIAQAGAAAWVRRIDVPLADGPLLFAAADVFAFPSRYEGFGLMSLEAMACGTPTIVADASSLPEVAGDAALLVPPDDQQGWADALRRLLLDAALREDLRARGLRRASLFTYEHTAALTAAVYRKTMNANTDAFKGPGKWPISNKM
jgi:glycosyltransferase involved in cell wall biosynthesis